MKRSFFALFFALSTVAGAQTLETLHEWPAPGLVGDPQGPMLVHGTDLLGVSTGGGANEAGFIFKIASDGSLTKLKDFDINAWTSKGGLILGLDGNYYGATFGGGPGSTNGFPGTGSGSIFRLTPGGTFTVLATAPHRNPVGELLEVSPLVFIGASRDVANDRGGAVYKADFSGPSASLSVLKTLDAVNVGRTNTGVIKGSDGKIYGTTERIIFRMDVDGQNYEELHRGNNVNDPLGRGFESGVTEGADGKLYGIASADGANGKGSIYRMGRDGMNFEALHHFNGTDGGGPNGGAVPQTRLLLHTDGNFYGTTRSGGASDGGALFKITPAGVFTKLRDFGASTPGGLASNGNNLVVTTNTYEFKKGRGVIYEVSTAGVSTVRYVFGDTLGKKALGAPILASDGHLYGTTAEGGAGGVGTFWRRKNTGEFDVLASFSGNISRPNSALIEGSDGIFYGTASGTFSSNLVDVFSATKDGKISEIIGLTDGSGIVEGSDGALYFSGGNRIFRVTKVGTLNNLKTMNSNEGSGGYSPPALGDDGALYGVTTGGGTNSTGTFWKYTGAIGGTFSVLRSFAANERPAGPLVKGRDGAFYGLLFNNGITTHYRLTTAGQFTALGATTSLAVDGEPAKIALVERNLGKFYAPLFGPTATDTTRRIFEFTASASPFITLAPSPATSFPTAAGPAIGGFSRGTDRNLYGVLPDGTGNSGSLYRVVMPASGDPLPAATTLAATNVQSLSATLNGEVTPNGTPVVVFFEYGATTAYGKRTPGVLIQPGAAATITVSAEATGLTRNAEFHFRLVAENDGGTANGLDQSATTTANSAPRAVTDTVPIRTKEVLTIAVLANDSDPDGDAFTMDSFTQGAKGAVTRVGDNLIYTPGKGFAGSDSFTYELSDSIGAVSTGQVFIQNPFLILGGNYSPIVGDDDGIMTLKVSPTGTLTGKLKVLGKTFTLKGVAGLDGAFTQTFKRTGLPDLVVTLAFTAPGQLATISGTVAGGPTEQFAVTGDTRLATTLPAPVVAGKYTIVLEPGAGMPAPMQAFGWARATISPKGGFSMSGQTPDGKPLALAGKMRVDTSVTLYKTSPAPGSSFVGKFAFTDAADSDFSGTLRWTRGAVTKGIHLGAFDTTFAVRGCKFTAPVKGVRTLVYTNTSAATGRVDLEGGALVTDIARVFAIDVKDKAVLAPTETSPELMKLSLISRSDGRIEGTFKHPALPKNPTIKFRGVQLQNASAGTGPNKAFGHFTVPTAAGSFTFTPL